MHPHIQNVNNSGNPCWKTSLVTDHQSFTTTFWNLPSLLHINKPLSKDTSFQTKVGSVKRLKIKWQLLPDAASSWHSWTWECPQLAHNSPTVWLAVAPPQGHHKTDRWWSALPPPVLQGPAAGFWAIPQCLGTADPLLIGAASTGVKTSRSVLCTWKNALFASSDHLLLVRKPTPT